MKATRKKEYSDKRKRKLTEHEISDLKLQQHNEMKAKRREKLIPIGKGLWRVEYV